MSKNYFTIVCRNAYGNIATGATVLLLGIFQLIMPNSILPLLVALLLLVLSCISLLTCLTKQHEKPDEMAAIDQGRAALFALITTLIVIGLLCIPALVLQWQISVSAACCMCMGLALLLYGVSFAWYERDEGIVNY